MQTKAPWPLDANIIEFDPPNGLLACSLVKGGYENYLAVVRADTFPESPALASRLIVSAEPGRVRKNNADVLILHGRAALAMGAWRSVRHSQWIALPWTIHPMMILAILMGLVQWALGRCERPSIFQLGESIGQRFIVWRVRRRAAPAVRQYIPQRLGVEQFFGTLRGSDHRHVVLRWFESFPAVAPGEDIDILIDDLALEFVRGLLKSGPGVQPIDVYTVTGLPGSDFRGLPYYAPPLAEQLLAGARDHGGLCCIIPSAKHHFLSLAYHALYHKGLSSGLPTNSGLVACQSPEHDYTSALRKLSCNAGYNDPITMEGLDRYLESQSWRPSVDMLARMACQKEWLSKRLEWSRTEDTDNGLCVFLLRALACQRGGIERAVQLIEMHGFHVLHSIPLADNVSEAAAKTIRGGNWGRGPWKTSGGPPVAAIVAYDSEPQPLSRRCRKRFPFVANARILCKEQIRDEFNRGLPKEQHCNMIHSSDNGHEALDYLSILCPQDVQMILERVAALNRGYETQEPLLATWTRFGRRAKIEVVEYQGRPVVKKTFKPHMQKFWAREVTALRELSRTLLFTPPLVAVGALWLMIPLYDDVLKYRRSSGKLLPLSVAKQAISALRDVYDAGFAVIDASVDNILVDRNEGLKVFDYEFCHRYQQRPARFEDSYDVAGCPASFDGELPIHGGNSYDRTWRPYVGLSLPSLLNDPVWLQHLKRASYYAIHAHRFVPRLLRHYAQSLYTRGIAHLGHHRESRAVGLEHSQLERLHATPRRVA